MKKNILKDGIDKVDDVLDHVKDEIIEDLPKIKKVVEKAVGKVSLALGNSTKDDEVISALLKTAIISGLATMSSGSIVITSAQLDPILSVAFKEINKREIAFGNTMIAKSEGSTDAQK